MEKKNFHLLFPIMVTPIKPDLNCYTRMRTTRINLIKLHKIVYNGMLLCWYVVLHIYLLRIQRHILMSHDIHNVSNLQWQFTHSYYIHISISFHISIINLLHY